MTIYMPVLCTGVDCLRRNTCERYLTLPTQAYAQSHMVPPPGDCPEYWERRNVPSASGPRRFIDEFDPDDVDSSVAAP